MAVAPNRVQSLAQRKLDAIPPEYIRPAEERKGMGDALEVVKAQMKEGTLQIPVLDLQAFNSGNEEIKQACIQSVRKAAEEWGVMHIAGHGISNELMGKVQEIGRKFFDLPIEQKEQYANDQASGIVQGYGSKFANNSHGKFEWQDYFFHLAYPVEKADFTIWPKEPADYM
jgi:anthocyanidin synthase